MEQAYIFDSVNAYNDFNNQETLHPLVSIIDFSTANKRTGSRMTFGLYCIFLKEANCGDLKYGCQNYDYDKGTLVFIAPGQVVDVANKVDVYQPMGHGLVFHPDLIQGTVLAKIWEEYSFFNYNSNEALHISERERKIIMDCFHKIAAEIAQPVDKHSRKLIASTIALFLNYCERFYDRQFITREQANRGVLESFESHLNAYFSSETQQETGVPTVAYFAEKCHLSANYFGDLVKKETGKTAQEFIQNKLIDIAKDRIFDTKKSINEIAYELGFTYPQHFNRLFKKRVGSTPMAFRNSQLN